MRQLVMTTGGVRVARMPRPAVGPGMVLVRVRYSLISTGTELSALRPSPSDGTSSPAATVQASVGLARHYMRAALNDPQKAARRVARIARDAARAVKPRPIVKQKPALTVGDLQWTRSSAAALERDGRTLLLTTNGDPGAYQALSQAIEIPAGCVPIVKVTGAVESGAVTLGLLNEARDAWLGSRVYRTGPFSDQLIFEPGSSKHFTVVVAGGGDSGPARLRLDTIDVTLPPALADGLPYSELDDQGWNIGYSAAGEVVAVGDGVTDLGAGDLVACAGAGYANHADYVSVPRNLVCRIPAGCSLELAATATVGAIALQGIRRARLELGERVAILGLGLIGQITTELVRAAGCTAIGMDLDPSRVARAQRAGLDAGAPSVDELKALVRDRTRGHGVDRTIVTAATKSDAVVNLAMEITRAKGTVVLVGDVGLNIQRPAFYRKEIDLLMSTSYGPGRYDAAYENEGRDYPFAHVRWTLNRNLESYLETIAARRIDVQRLIDRVVPVDRAPALYAELVRPDAETPLGVLIQYPDDTRTISEPADSPAIHLRGARPPRDGALQYALVGAGAFGTGMLVPQMEKRRDLFFLRAVVSRNTTQGGNFARAQQVDLLATELAPVLSEPSIDLVVIATRHHDHAAQVAQALEAGKHVFVEKPLALTWDDLDRVVAAHESRSTSPALLVGFNRRFSPALQTLRRVLADRRTPLMINYRLNGGYIPLDSWIQGLQGGGRNIGEACHMYDVFRFLAGAPVVTLSATAINPGTLPYLRSDNFSATLAYGDGSVAHLMYTALGPKEGLPKERIEVFCDGDAYIVDDFKSLTRASTSTTLWHAPETDKGHFEELSRFGEAIRSGGESPIPFDEIIETSGVALAIEEMLVNPAAGEV